MTPIEQAKAYEPIFYHHKSETWVPVRPAGKAATNGNPTGFVGAARLWLAESAIEARRKDPQRWGRCRIPQLANVPPTFEQGTPLIGRGNITVDPNDEQDDYAENFGGHMYLGHDETPGKHAEDCVGRRFPFTETARRGENFLDVAGWKATDGPEPLSVTGDYAQPGIDRAKGIWTSAARANDLDVAFVEIVEGAEALSPEVLTALNTRFKVDGLRVFLYYAVFPMHEEAGLGATRADYEGDWACLAVVAPPAAATATAAPSPVAVGYGRRNRMGRKGDTFRIRFTDTFPLNVVGSHPKAFVALGTHNLHSQPGGDPTKVEEAVNDKVEDVEKKANDKLDELDTKRDTVVVITKILAGAGIGGAIGGLIGAGIGAIIGGIAGAIEAATNDPPDIDIGGGGGPGGPGGGHKDDVPSTAFGVILTPQSVTVPEASAASAVRNWRDAVDQRVVDRDKQSWWRDSECLPAKEDRPAYAGRWGVMCTDDRLDIRSGMAFPDFACALDRSLLEELSGDPEA